MEQVCPRCKTSSYDKPSLKLLVNVCGHHICGSCVDAVFVRPTAPCPECGLALRRNLYRQQQFEDPNVEKEVDIRKKVLHDYNQTEEDFSSLTEYNNYLEEVESIVHNLTHGVDVEGTKQKVEQYQRDHQVVIMRNRERQRRREKVHQLLVQEEQEERELRNRRAQAVHEQAVRERQRERQSVIQELMTSDRPAIEVVASHSARQEQQEGREEGGGMVGSDAGTISSVKDSSVPTYFSQTGTAVFDQPAGDEGQLYHYQSQTEHGMGPPVPELEELGSYGYVSHVWPVPAALQGSGYGNSYTCHRALQEAFSGLYYITPLSPSLSPSPSPPHKLATE